MTYQDTTHAHVADNAPPTGAGHLIPVIGGSILTLLWGAYTLTILAHIAMMPLP